MRDDDDCSVRGSGQKGDGGDGAYCAAQLQVAEKIDRIIYRPMWKLSEAIVAPSYAGWAGN